VCVIVCVCIYTYTYNNTHVRNTVFPVGVTTGDTITPSSASSRNSFLTCPSWPSPPPPHAKSKTTSKSRSTLNIANAFVILSIDRISSTRHVRTFLPCLQAALCNLSALCLPHSSEGRLCVCVRERVCVCSREDSLGQLSSFDTLVWVPRLLCVSVVRGILSGFFHFPLLSAEPNSGPLHIFPFKPLFVLIQQTLYS